MGVWPSARASGLRLRGGPTWFPMDSASRGGVNHYNSTMRETEGVELGCRTLLQEVGITQRYEQNTTAVSNHPIRGLLDLRSISTPLPKQHCTRPGREQASKGRSDDLTDLCSICPLSEELRAGMSLPWLQSPWCELRKSGTWNFVLCLQTYSMKGVLIRGTKEETGSQVSSEGPYPLQRTLSSTPQGVFSSV